MGQISGTAQILNGYLVSRLETSVGDFSNRELLVVGLLGRDDWSVCYQREMNSGVGHQVCLELSQINVQSTVKSQRGGDRRYYLSNQPDKDLLLSFHNSANCCLTKVVGCPTNQASSDAISKYSPK